MSMKQIDRLVKTIPDYWVFEEDESFSKSFMVVGIISGYGTILLLRVTTKVKINAEYYSTTFRSHSSILSPSPSFVSERNGQSVIFLFEAETFRDKSENIELDLVTCSREVVYGRFRFNHKRIQQLEKTLTVKISQERVKTCQETVST